MNFYLADLYALNSSTILTIAETN